MEGGTGWSQTVMIRGHRTALAMRHMYGADGLPFLRRISVVYTVEPEAESNGKEKHPVCNTSIQASVLTQAESS